MNQRNIKLLEEEKRLKEWKRRLVRESKCFNENERRSSTKIKLNVGGKLFQTSLTTLQCADEGSVLAAMFSGRFSLKKDVDGYVFIDRNGTVFEYILSFLRDGAQKAPIFESLHVTKLVYREAQHFGLTRLENAIYPPIATPYQLLIREQLFLESKAWSNKMDFTSFTLKYASKRHGFAASTFHKMCDRRGPSIVVVQTQAGAVLAGYAEWSWGTDPSKVLTCASFLTILQNTSGKFVRKSWNHKTSKWGPDYAQCGPYFGSKGLIISSACLHKRVGEHSSSTSVKNCVFHGKKFCLKDYEVYLQEPLPPPLDHTLE